MEEIAGSMPRFHLAVAVDNLAAARDFYAGLPGCRERGSSTEWIDFDFFGHQLVVHCEASQEVPATRQRGNLLSEGTDRVPVPHFGVVVAWDHWQHLVEQLAERRIVFRSTFRARSAGLPMKRASLFFQDPSGNVIEFKSYENMDQLEDMSDGRSCCERTSGVGFASGSNR